MICAVDNKYAYVLTRDRSIRNVGYKDQNPKKLEAILLQSKEIGKLHVQEIEFQKYIIFVILLQLKVYKSSNEIYLAICNFYSNHQ